MVVEFSINFLKTLQTLKTLKKETISVKDRQYTVNVILQYAYTVNVILPQPYNKISCIYSLES